MITFHCTLLKLFHTNITNSHHIAYFLDISKQEVQRYTSHFVNYHNAFIATVLLIIIVIIILILAMLTYYYFALLTKLLWNIGLCLTK